MARYIDADKLIAHLVDEKERCPNDEIEYPISYGCRLGLQGAISFAETQTTADVVPKSEVERLETEVRLLTENSISAKYPCHVLCSKGLILTKSLEEYDKLLADISSEVAREIFEEIEEDCLDFPMYDCDIQIILDKGRYNELKKKYTEDQNNEN